MTEPTPPPYALEIRVHGVHGTSPNSMLGVESKQVAGDKLTGIYRAVSTDGTEEALPYRKLNSGHAVEAYSWGALTSGVQGVLGWIRRVLWLTLLPFAFVNVAFWARFHLDPKNSDTGGVARLGAACLRWAGLLLTCLMILTPCILAIDLVAWQCFGNQTNGCPRLPGVLDFLARLSAPARMSVASLAPLALLALLWALSGTTRSRYEAVQDTEGIDTQGMAQPLRSTDMWSGEPRCRRLQYIHVTLGLTTVVIYTGFHVLHSRPVLGPSLWLTSGLAVVLWLYCFVASLGVDGSDDSIAALPILALVLTAAHLGLLWFAKTDASFEIERFHGNNWWLIIVMFGLVSLNSLLFLSRLKVWQVVFLGVFCLLVLGVLGYKNQSGLSDDDVKIAVCASILLWIAMMLWHLIYTDDDGDRHHSTAWRGGAPAVLLGAGAWIALLFTSASVIGVADYLNGTEQTVSKLDTSRGSISQPQAGTSVTLSGSVTVRDSVVLRAKDGSLSIVGGTIEASSAFGAGDSEVALFDNTLVKAGTTASLSDGSMTLIDSCMRLASAKSTTKPCRPSSTDFVERATASVGKSFQISEREAKLEITSPPQRSLIVPQVLIWTPLIQLLWILLAVLLLVFALARYWGKAGRQIYNKQFAGDQAIPDASSRDVRKQRRVAGLAHRAERLTDIIGSMTTLIGLFLLVGISSNKPPWELLPSTQPLSTLSLYAAVGSALLLVLLGSYVRRSESTRKAVGILWDLTTFWPRAAHPLAPPCYAERVVPELTTRIRWALGKGALVVFSGHSQGSLIAVAVASRLKNEELARIRMVTYGSQVRALYGRVFPAVFGPEFIGNTATPGAPSLRDGFPEVPQPGTPTIDPTAAVPPTAEAADGCDPDAIIPLYARFAPGHWINLVRRTDPLGYRVFSDADAEPDRVVQEVPVVGVGDPGPRVGGHSYYQHTPEYRTVVGGWLVETVVGVPVHVTKIEPLPLD